jgi:rhamnulokinase
MATRVYLAVDLGAESGRVMAGLWNGRKIKLQEVHRFPNGGVPVGGTLRWNVLGLWQSIHQGLTLAARQYGKNIASVGADTWGVDFVLLNRQDELLGLPYHYRDARTQGVMERAFRRVPREKIFAQTGLQFLPFNSLFQLLAWQKQAPQLLEAADRLLFMPDYFHWCLCGSRVAEFTIASTSQCLHPLKRDWNRSLLKALGLPLRLLPPLVQPGTVLGPLRPEVAEGTGLRGVRVIAPPSHDTAAAVAGVPTAHTGKANWAYISSGTWSLMGAEVAQASLTPRTLAYNLTNEGGLDGTYRLLKNIMGLWLVQRCKAAYDAEGKNYDYAELVRLAAAAPAFRSLVNPDDPRFLNPKDMRVAIQEYCRETGQPIPRTAGELVRCAYESLALRYRQVLGWLEELTGQRMEVIHIVGGGSKSELLNQFTASACNRPVITGPVEATALGNLMTQVRADGEVRSLADMREVIRRSSEMRRYQPADLDKWDMAAARFAALAR